jgi:hypothetical protein
MRHAHLILTIIVSLLITSCGTTNVYVNHNSTYTRSNPITIITEDDRSGALGELQYQLLSNGYKLISLSTAKKALNLDTESSSSTFHAEVTNTTTFKTAYVLEYHYSAYHDPFLMQYRFAQFSASITDLVSGEIIMTARFSGDKSVQNVISELVMEMNKVIKKKQY